MASTVLPNGIIIPEKYSRDWYNDLYHNWQELDNLLGGGTPKDGTLTIQKNGSTVGTFSANQATNETVNITVPTATSELTNDSNFVQSSDLATVATSGSYTDLSDKPTIPTVNDATLTIQKNGTDVATFSANSSTNATANITVPTKTSDLTNDSGFITEDTTKIPLAGSNQISGSLIPSTDGTVNLGGSSYQWNNAYIKSLTINGVACGDILTHNASEFVPRSGGAVMTATSLGRTDNSSSITFCGGTDAGNGGCIKIYGKDTANNYYGDIFITANDGAQSNSIHVKPNGDTRLTNCEVFYSTTDNFTRLGHPAYRWKEVCAATGTINTSDSRLKNNIKDIDNKLLDAWENIEPKQYKFNDATEKKGEKARYHTGYLAQDIQAECEKQGVNASDYGLFCHDSWEEQEEKKDENGQVIEPYRAKGDLYALRYEEALVVECKYLRRCIARLTARIEELEKGNNTK